MLLRLVIAAATAALGALSALPAQATGEPATIYHYYGGSRVGGSAIVIGRPVDPSLPSFTVAGRTFFKGSLPTQADERAVTLTVSDDVSSEVRLTVSQANASGTTVPLGSSCLGRGKGAKFRIALPGRPLYARLTNLGCSGVPIQGTLQAAFSSR